MISQKKIKLAKSEEKENWQNLVKDKRWGMEDMLRMFFKTLYALGFQVWVQFTQKEKTRRKTQEQADVTIAGFCFNFLFCTCTCWQWGGDGVWKSLI